MRTPKTDLRVYVYRLTVTAAMCAAQAMGGLISMDGWEASNKIVTTITPGAANYATVHGTPRPGYSGIAGLVISRPGGTGLCTGSLLNSTTLLTAAHCLADSSGNLVATGAQAVFFPASGGTYVDNAAMFEIHPGYTGSVFDDHDIAVVRLVNDAPSELDKYKLYSGNSVGRNFEFVGFGGRGQGNTGATIAAGSRARGYNRFDTTGASLLPLLGITTANTVLMYDFDNGLAANDAFGFWLGLSDLGLGQFESNSAGGDSGGPSFINGRIAAVTSFGLTFSATLPSGTVLTSDVLAGLNSSFGEFSGNTSVRANEDWLRSVLVPEPSSWMMAGAGLLVLAALSRRGRA